MIAMSMFYQVLPLIFYKFILVSSSESSSECIKKDFGYDSFVCVCNESFCDWLPEISVQSGKVLMITSNKNEKRWHKQILELNSHISKYDEGILSVKINPKKKFQTVLGFGGAFTDAATLHVTTASENVGKSIMKSYFSSNGLEYNLGRVPIGGSDFSTHAYTYDDLSPGQIDSELSFFNLTHEDYLLKIPVIKNAQRMISKRGSNLKLIASPWSAPAWMKDNKRINGNGKLLKKYYDLWAKYIVRFLKEYSENGVNFYGVTTQNEPTAGYGFNYSFNQMAWNPQEQGLWISDYLGPKLEKSDFDAIKIFALDDMRFLLPLWMKKLMKHKNASKYVSGIAVHWYWDFISPSALLDETHKLYPNLPILYTEACTGWALWDFKKVMLGSWKRAESYAANIIDDFEHWAVGWIDWNFVLDTQGGPNWAKNFVDSPIIFDQVQNVFYRQPMFYALAHFSKFACENSVRMHHEITGRISGVQMVAFQRPDNAKVLVVLNKNSSPVNIEVKDGENLFHASLDEKSIVSFLWM